MPYMAEFREINCAVSCRSFVGHYMSDEVVRKISDDYYCITAALDLVNFPIIIPFTRTWYGKKASDYVLSEFEKCAKLSKAKMLAGGQPSCTLDFWVQNMFESEKAKEAKERGEEYLSPNGEKPPSIRIFTDFEIAQTLFTFLFASQDASSSATTWLFQILADRPDVMARVREEQLAVRDGDAYKPLNMELMDKMTYTRAVVKECLRYRPPVTMVPYEVKKDFPVTPDYVIPKGEQTAEKVRRITSY